MRKNVTGNTDVKSQHTKVSVSAILFKNIVNNPYLSLGIAWRFIHTVASNLLERIIVLLADGLLVVR